MLPYPSKNMSESELFQLASLQYYNSNDVELCLDDEHANYAQFDVSPSFTETMSLSNIDFVDHVPVDDDNLNGMEFLFDESLPIDFEELELIWRQEIEENSEEKVTTESPSIVSGDAFMNIDCSNLIELPLILPTEGMETSNQLSLDNLSKAYGEAIENKQAELAEVIMRRIGEKVCPLGDIRERLLYYASIQPFGKQAEYINQECCKNFGRALEAFYQILPNGMIPHFTANSAILEAKSHDAEILHVVDFDIGEGIQWSSMIMALSKQQNEMMQRHYCNRSHLPQQTILKLTAMKWREDDSCYVPSWRKFEETRRRLQDYAESLGILLHVEEMEMQDLWRETKRMRKRGGRKEWLAFNCMWALPHMARRRSRRHVIEFLTMAEDLIAADCRDDSRKEGIVTFGDGGGDEALIKKFHGFGSFFESYMEHYQGVLESIEWSLPIDFVEARLSMECLFLAPFVSGVSIMQKWHEIEEARSDLITMGLGFEGLRVSKDRLMEAKEMVREGDTPYGIRIEGENSNVLVLEWRGTIPLVKVAAWR